MFFVFPQEADAHAAQLALHAREEKELLDREARAAKEEAQRKRAAAKLKRLEVLRNPDAVAWMRSHQHYYK